MSEVIKALVEEYAVEQLRTWRKEVVASVAEFVQVTQVTQDGQSASGTVLSGNRERVLAQLRIAIAAREKKDAGESWEYLAVDPPMGHVMNFSHRRVRT